MSAAAPPPENLVNRRVVLLAVCLGAFMATLDTSIVNIALPQIAQDFRVSLVQISWVMLIYLLMNVSLLLTSGRLGDLLPPGKLFLLGLVGFTGASALCGLSPGLAWMLGGRALQGLGVSLMLGVAPKLIALTFDEGERGLALGLFLLGLTWIRQSGWNPATLAALGMAAFLGLVLHFLERRQPDPLLHRELWRRWRGLIRRRLFRCDDCLMN